MGAVRFASGTTIVAVTLSAAAACSSGGSAGPTPTPSPATNYAQELQTLATTGMQQSYTAIYSLRSTKPVGTATVQVGRTPTAYRVSVQRGTSISILIRNSYGTYSCQRQPKKPRKVCYVVAKRGRPVPSVFDAGQKVWSDYLIELSRNGLRYDVKNAGTTAPTSVLPAGTCFSVTPVGTPTATTVAQGTYCLTDGGIPTKAAFPSGTFTLTQILRAPRPNELVPITKPIPIPGLK